MNETAVTESEPGDEFGYPLEISVDALFVQPVTLRTSATPADHERHAAAYTAYQQRFSAAFADRRRRRREEDGGASRD
jgi:hypothetical protein